MNKNSTKAKTVNFHQMPSKLWRILKKHVPKARKKGGAGRPRVNDRNVLNGIWFILWTGCQWKAVDRHWFPECVNGLRQSS